MAINMALCILATIVIMVSFMSLVEADDPFKGSNRIFVVDDLERICSRLGRNFPEGAESRIGSDTHPALMQVSSSSSVNTPSSTRIAAPSLAGNYKTSPILDNRDATSAAGASDRSASLEHVESILNSKI